MTTDSSVSRKVVGTRGTYNVGVKKGASRKETKLCLDTILNI